MCLHVQHGKNIQKPNTVQAKKRATERALFMGSGTRTMAHRPCSVQKYANKLEIYIQAGSQTVDSKIEMYM